MCATPSMPAYSVCPLDTLRVNNVGSTIAAGLGVDFTEGSDSHLAAELMLLHNLLQHDDGVDGEDHNHTMSNGEQPPYASCLVLFEPVVGCLDVAGPSTLRSVGGGVDAVLVTGADRSAAAGWCNLTVSPSATHVSAATGDGRLDSLDYALLSWIFYRQQTGDLDSLDDITGVGVNMREHARSCLAHIAMHNSSSADGAGDEAMISMARTIADSDDAYLISSDLATYACNDDTLEQTLPMTSSVVKDVSRHTVIPDRGTWYFIESSATSASPFAAIELRLLGVVSDAPSELSNGAPPSASSSTDPGDIVQVRLSRAPGATNACDPLVANIGAGLLVGTRLGLRHLRPLMSCYFDLYIWVPNRYASRSSSSSCPFGIDTHSRGMTLRSHGALQSSALCVSSLTDAYTGQTTSPPAQPPPQPTTTMCGQQGDACVPQQSNHSTDWLGVLQQDIMSVSGDDMNCCTGTFCDATTTTCQAAASSSSSSSSYSVAVQSPSVPPLDPPPPFPSPQPPPSPLPPWPSLPVALANSNTTLALMTVVIVSSAVVGVVILMVLVARFTQMSRLSQKLRGIRKPLMVEESTILAIAIATYASLRPLQVHHRAAAAFWSSHQTTWCRSDNPTLPKFATADSNRTTLPKFATAHAVAAASTTARPMRASPNSRFTQTQ